MENFSFILDKALNEKDFLEYKQYLQNSAIYELIEADGIETTWIELENVQQPLLQSLIIDW